MIVGLFVVVFSIGVFWFAFWLSKYGLQEEYYTYRIDMKDSVAGLSKNSNVKFHGVNIGRVSKIRIDPNNIEIINVFVDIKQDVPIKEDMIASTKMLGVTGLLSIEIYGGSNESKTLLASNTVIPLIQSKPSLFSTLTDDLGDLSEKLNHLLSYTEVLLSDKNLNNVSQILDNVEKVTATGEILEHKAIESMEEIDSTLKEFRVSMAIIKQDFTVATTDFKTIKDVTVPTVDKLFETSKNFNRVILKFEKSLDRGDYNLKKMLAPLLVDIQILSSQLNYMTKSLSHSPNELLFKSRKSRRGPGE